MIGTKKRDEYWQSVLEKERAYWQSLVRELTNQITLLKVEPQMAAVQAVPADFGESPYLSQFDDGAVAEYERQRTAVTEATKSFIEQHESAE